MSMQSNRPLGKLPPHEQLPFAQSNATGSVGLYRMISCTPTPSGIFETTIASMFPSRPRLCYSRKTMKASLSLSFGTKSDTFGSDPNTLGKSEVPSLYADFSWAKPVETTATENVKKIHNVRKINLVNIIASSSLSYILRVWAKNPNCKFCSRLQEPY